MAFEQNVKRYFFADASVPLHAFRCSLVRLMKFWLWSKLFAECIVAELTVSFDPKSRKKTFERKACQWDFRGWYNAWFYVW